MNKTTLISVGVIVIAVVAALVILQNQANKPRIYDTFASCLGEKGAKFYGAFWCPHCAEQKAMFKGSEEFLPYVECSTPDSKGQTDICIEKVVASYPTWEFADGSRLTGAQNLGTLAEKTGCPLPTGDDSIEDTGADIGGSSEAI